MPEFIRLDMFPSTVTMPDGTIYDPARAIVSENTIYVFMNGSPPEAVVTEKLSDFTSVNRNRYTATTDDTNEEIIITKRAGCGCGNRLRGFRPFPGVPLLRS